MLITNIRQGRTKKIISIKFALKFKQTIKGGEQETFSKDPRHHRRVQIEGWKSEEHAGGDLCEESLVKERWRVYTEDLYKSDHNITTRFTEVIYEDEVPIIEEEVRKAVKSLANGNSPGLDDYPLNSLRKWVMRRNSTNCNLSANLMQRCLAKKVEGIHIHPDSEQR
ncbi:hypothetical protein BSL78_00776 [Apostichopus japonicus]|uniref:Uncharacterized protein n=1 Tax=Stichopus japonicus TaxID=307972 RepID=A0A2G8LPR9_STIJA|nr:hypothetical protein BSL78_00776 [Apostichopus japonicus]